MDELSVDISSGVAELDPGEWNRIAAGGGPFVRHEFLTALEETGCVGPNTGWIPQILVARDRADDRLVGAAPLYIKTHSAGEFVFDWGWAEAAQRAGIQYYPKGVVAIPFTPVTGGRLLVGEGAERAESIRRMLVDEALAFAERSNLSSIHFNFLQPEDRRVLEERGLPVRESFQYHWYNGRRDADRGPYEDFDDFLGEFRSKKRSNIRRERRKLREAGVEPEILEGEAVTPAHLRRMYRYYRRTVEKYFGGSLYLNEEFFLTLGREMGDRLQMVVLEREGEEFAGAFNMLGDDRLFGRYWGATEEIDFAHFEACFYSSIEWCIDRGVDVFEGGSGGDHKVDRGFEPTRTYSAHHVRHPALVEAIEDFIDRESRKIDRQLEEMREDSPFKSDGDGGPSGEG
ncbi:MAG: GNAT family N-acetyltransferase [Bradymonadaceae bacterium]